MNAKETKLRYLVNFIAVAALFAAAVALGLTGGDTMKLRITPSIWQCGYLIVMAASLNLVLGFLGQLSLGHCGFMAVGGYAAALISLAFPRACMTRSPARRLSWCCWSAPWQRGCWRRYWDCWWASRPCG